MQGIGRRMVCVHRKSQVMGEGLSTTCSGLFSIHYVYGAIQVSYFHLNFYQGGVIFSHKIILHYLKVKLVYSSHHFWAVL